MQEITPSTGEPAKKLENFLKQRFPIGYVRKLFRKHGVRLNGKRGKPLDTVGHGDKVQLYIPFEAESATAKTAAVHFAVVFEDEALLAIDKPAGLAVHEGKTVAKRDSLLGILESKYRETTISPSLVHRLDKDTSGLLLVAKNPKTKDQLEQAFETSSVEKEYLCLVVGRLPQNEGKLDWPLPGRDGNPARSLTRYRVVKRYAETTLVRATIETGRLHQIRLHFAKLGFPVVMDDQHGDFAFNKRFRKQYGLKRQFLHAEKLRLNYAGNLREWSAPLAKDLATTLELLASRNLNQRN